MGSSGETPVKGDKNNEETEAIVTRMNKGAAQADAAATAAKKVLETKFSKTLVQFWRRHLEKTSKIRPILGQ